MGFAETHSTERRRPNGPRESSGWLGLVLLVVALAFALVLSGTR